MEQPLYNSCSSQCTLHQCRGPGSAWTRADGWSMQIGSNWAAWQQQQDCTLFAPSHGVQKLQVQTPEVSRASDAWQGLHPTPLTHWAVRNNRTQFACLSPCHFVPIPDFTPFYTTFSSLVAAATCFTTLCCHRSLSPALSPSPGINLPQDI